MGVGSVVTGEKTGILAGSSAEVVRGSEGGVHPVEGDNSTINQRITLSPSPYG